MTKIWAHRGASASAPENTMPAFELAIEQGADGVELDVQRSADGELVVIHDERIDRTSGASGRVVDLTLEELRRHRYGAGMEGFDDAQLPLLAEVLELFAPTEMVVNVELKTSIEWYPGIEHEAWRVVEESAMGERVIFSSFNHYTLLGLRERVAPWQLGLLFSDVIVEPWSYAVELGMGALHPGYYLLQQPGYVERAHEAELAVHTWTVDDPVHLQLVAGSGVDAIVTNTPDVARRTLGLGG